MYSGKLKRLATAGTVATGRDQGRSHIKNEISRRGFGHVLDTIGEGVANGFK